MAINIREALVVILARKDRSRADQKRVEERVRANKCLMMRRDDSGPELVDCPHDATSSCGNCIACDRALKSHEATLSPEEAVRARQEVILRGWRLAPQEIRKYRTKYPFAKLG